MILRGPTVVKSITFYTNKKKYGPFGDEQGVPFSSGSKDGIIVGFHGRKGWFVESIGVHVLEGKLSLPRPSYDVFNKTDIRISEVSTKYPFEDSSIFSNCSILQFSSIMILVNFVHF